MIAGFVRPMVYVIALTIANVIGLKAQQPADTMLLEHPVSIFSLGNSQRGTSLTISDRHFKTPMPARHINFFHFLTESGRQQEQFEKLIFKRCSFDIQSRQSGESNLPAIDKHLVFDSCELDYFYAAHLRRNASFFNSDIRSLMLDSLQGATLLFNQLKVLNYFGILRGQNISLNLQNIWQADTALFGVFNSSLRETTIFANMGNRITYSFVRDTIKGLVFLSNIEESQQDLHAVVPSLTAITFSDCLVASDFVGVLPIPRSKLAFEHCSFLQSCNLTDLTVDSLSIDDAQVQSPSVFISFMNKKKVWLRLINVDMRSIQFNFDQSVHLYFDSSDTDDEISSTFEQLLSKYRAEGKPNAVENVDVQYKTRMQPGWLNGIDRVWWYHGYRKRLVFYWAALFLVVFSVINFFCWRPLCATYALMNQPAAVAAQQRTLPEKIFDVVVYTFLIFFTVYIHFDRLDFRRRFWVAVLMVQYVTGLVCLFFILNFILKIP